MKKTVVEEKQQIGKTSTDQGETYTYENNFACLPICLGAGGDALTNTKCSWRRRADVISMRLLRLRLLRGATQQSYAIICWQMIASPSQPPWIRIIQRGIGPRWIMRIHGAVGARRARARAPGAQGASGQCRRCCGRVDAVVVESPASWAVLKTVNRVGGASRPLPADLRVVPLLADEVMKTAENNQKPVPPLVYRTRRHGPARRTAMRKTSSGKANDTLLTALFSVMPKCPAPFKPRASATSHCPPRLPTFSTLHLTQSYHTPRAVEVFPPPPCPPTGSALPLYATVRRKMQPIHPQHTCHVFDLQYP